MWYFTARSEQFKITEMSPLDLPEAAYFRTSDCISESSLNCWRSSIDTSGQRPKATAFITAEFAITVSCSSTKRAMPLS